MDALPPGLYAIADASFGDPVDQGLRLAAAGCRVIQVRAKEWTELRVARAVRLLLPVLREHGCLLIVNDHLRVALDEGADGLHLGQDDGDPLLARATLGPEPLLGVSTHDLEQVRAANRLVPAPDYLGFGPVFPTATTKADWRGRGPRALADAVTASRLPIVAIGGITPERLEIVKAAGAVHWAAISALARPGDLSAAVQALG